MSKIKVIYIALFLLFVAPAKAEAQSEYIYLVKVFGCQKAPACARVQTGFRVRGVKGIVTALHGVADANDIRVMGDQGAARFTGKLKIGKVDVAHDIALLTSDEIERAPADGLDVSGEVNWETLGMINVVGRPLGLSANLATALPLRRPPLKTLRDLVPPDIAVKLLDRRSPDPDEAVVSINGVLLPGHSGAPLLNSQNQLVAVGNGGLLGGSSGICWAIPWRHVQLADAAANARLASLSKADPKTLFSFEDENESKMPEIYRVRITVVGPQQTPVDDAKVIASTGGEALKAAGGYQYEIPRAKRPQDGKVVFWVSKESAFLKGEATLELGSDPNPSVTVDLTIDNKALNEVADSKLSLGRSLLEEGKYTNAASALEEAAELRPNHRLTLYHLGRLYYKMEWNWKAEKYFKQLVKVLEEDEQIGPEHLNVATGLDWLVAIFKRQARYGEAEPLVRRALAIVEKRLGAGHPYMAVLLENYAGLLRMMNRAAEAEVMNARAEKIKAENTRAHPKRRRP